MIFSFTTEGVATVEMAWPVTILTHTDDTKLDLEPECDAIVRLGGWKIPVLTSSVPAEEK